MSRSTKKHRSQPGKVEAHSLLSRSVYDRAQLGREASEGVSRHR
jgi:hypothetical protein